MSQIIDSLTWRYAAKKFDPTKKLSDEQLAEILEAIRLAPTSFGLQPFKVLVITDTGVRNLLQTHSWNQSQVSEASHLIVFCAKTHLGEKEIEDYLQLIARERGVGIESLAGFRKMLSGFAGGLSEQASIEWAKKQAYIAMSFAMFACAEMRIDCCPMEGFDPKAVDEDLGLAAQGLTIATLLPVGFRAADDKAATMKKVRYPKEVLIKIAQ